MKRRGIYRIGDLRSGEPRWRAMISVNGRRLHLGVFGTEQEAQTAFADADRRFRDGWGMKSPTERIASTQPATTSYGGDRT